MQRKPVVLFLCTGNSCRSQMAERFLRAKAGDRFEVHSAGLSPAQEIHPIAERVMAEIGLSMAGQVPKSLKQYLGRVAVWHLVVVCARAEERCPTAFPNVMNKHYWPFEDPAAVLGTPEEVLAKFREIRDRVGLRIDQWLAESSQTK